MPAAALSTFIYLIQIYVCDGRPLPPEDAGTANTLDEAKAFADKRIKAEGITVGDWHEQFGTWYREGEHYGYSVYLVHIDSLSAPTRKKLPK